MENALYPYSVSEDLNISLVTGSRLVWERLSEQIRSTFSDSSVSWYYYESSLLEVVEDVTVDILIIDRIAGASDWKIQYDKFRIHKPDTIIVYLLGEDAQGTTSEMINSGVSDILIHSDLNRIRHILLRSCREIENRRALEKLASDKFFNDHIANNSRSMLSIINRDYVYVKVNSRFCSAHNIKTENVVGRSLQEIWGGKTFKEKIKENIDLCFEGNTVRYEANFNTPLFGERFYEVVFHPIPSESGEVTHLLAETFDITDLRLSQQVIREMEEEFKKLETNLPIGFLRCEPDGTIIHANKAFMNIMEVEHEDNMKGFSINEFYSEKNLFEIHRKQLGSEKIKTFGRVPLYTFKGSEIACRISGFIVNNEEGNQSFIDFAFEDCSRELMLENRLIQAHKLETIGSLAGGLAHDFNNILGTIIGYSELILEENSENPGMCEKVNRIISAVTKAKNLTNQILTFSRQVEQQRIAVSVSEVLNETIGFIEAGLPDEIVLSKNIDGNGDMVLADPMQLFRVFLNLMSNGIQAMEEKGGVLSVSLSLIEGIRVRHLLSRDIIADEYSVVTIEDTGVGMDASMVGRIFEPYFTTKAVGKGTGLGLSVVHGIVSEIEGEIVVSSKKNKGSVFSIYLPVTKADDGPIEVRGRTRELLFITGNRHESKILSLALEKQGYNLTTASSESKLEEIISDIAHHPEIILYMDDSEAIKPDFILTLFSEHKLEIPLILITDTEHSINKENLLNSGVAKQVLNKPVSLREIDNAIQVSLV